MRLKKTIGAVVLAGAGTALGVLLFSGGGASAASAPVVAPTSGPAVSVPAQAVDLSSRGLPITVSPQPASQVTVQASAAQAAIAKVCAPVDGQPGCLTPTPDSIQLVDLTDNAAAQDNAAHPMVNLPVYLAQWTLHGNACQMGMPVAPGFQPNIPDSSTCTIDVAVLPSTGAKIDTWEYPNQ